jgi:hypothetical protein
MTSSPLVLWDYCMERRVLIFHVTAKKLFQHNGVNPHTITFGTEADIRAPWSESLSLNNELNICVCVCPPTNYHENSI